MPKAKNERNNKVPCYAPDINTIVQIHFIFVKFCYTQIQN